MSGAIGPQIPAHLLKGKSAQNDDDESSDDDYGPALPPDLASTATMNRKVAGPSFPSSRPQEPNDESDEECGPLPLPPGQNEEEDGVQQFLEREKRRQKAIEEDAKPKALKRDEWMLKPPEASDLLATLDPTKLKARQFSRKTEDKIKDQTLWTETPAERQQRLADEVSGKRKRAEASAGGGPVVEETLEDRKRKRRDRDIEEKVQEYNKKTRGETLLDLHSKSAAASKSREEETSEYAIWDRDRDMAVGGRLMDDKARSKLVQDAKGLGSRFGRGTTGGFL